jgi:two-component system, NarL family, sensor histidine kinase UhpB
MGTAVRLLLQLVKRLVGVTLLCLAGAVAWSMFDAHRSIQADAAASADRVEHQLQRLYWQKLLWRGGMNRETLLPPPEWRSLVTLNLVSPGVCVIFAPPKEEARRLCSQIEAIGAPAPAWFARLDGWLFGQHPAIVRALSPRDWDTGTVTTAAEPEAALRQSWRQVSVVASIAAAMAAGVCLLAALTIGHALRPARAIIQELRKLEQGDYSQRLPKFGAAEFDHIARAVNTLAEKLSRTSAARAALTTRLFQVQEEERRSLARDLHDEFGQCLTATVALATLIEANAAPEHEELAQDARVIIKQQRRMMDVLRGALVRLRSQHIEEVGLEASLRQLVSDYNAQSASRAVFRLTVAAELAALPREASIDIYRIAQECLTNAARHGSPTEVRLNVGYASGVPGAIALTVEDDGGGDAARINRTPGFGVLGLQERIAALGGSLSIGRAARGVRVAAIIPVLASRDLSAAGACA